MKRYMEHIFKYNSGENERYLLPITKEYELKSDEELSEKFTEITMGTVFKPLFVSSGNGQYNFIDKDGYYTLIKLSDISRFSFKIVWLEE